MGVYNLVPISVRITVKNNSLHSEPPPETRPAHVLDESLANIVFLQTRAIRTTLNKRPQNDLISLRDNFGGGASFFLNLQDF